jgi:hypothetical protein
MQTFPEAFIEAINIFKQSNVSRDRHRGAGDTSKRGARLEGPRTRPIMETRAPESGSAN